MLDYFKELLENKSMDDQANKEILEASKRPPGTVFIALAGKKQTGKDTSAKFIREMLEARGRKVKLVAFADPLKEMCINILGLKRELVYGGNEEKNTPTHIGWGSVPDNIRCHYGYENTQGKMTVREVLQVVGTNLFRHMLDDQVWVRIPFEKDWGSTDVVILTDCRFPNEKHFTEARGGRIIKLERDTGFEDHHASETALNNESFQYVIDNNGSLEDLYQALQTLLTAWGLL